MLVLTAALTWYGRADAAVLYGNAITGTNPSAENPYNTGEYTDFSAAVDLANSTLTRGAGLTAASAADRFSASAFNVTTEALAVSGNKYYALTLAPTTGNFLDFTSLAITLQQSGTGPTNYALRSSLDNYTADITTGTLTAGGTNALTLDLSAATFDNVTTAISFRLYEYGASGSGGTGSINDFAFNGAVPEPATYLAGALLVGVLGWKQRRALGGLAGWTESADPA